MPAIAYLLAGAFAWDFAMGLIMILIPLYAHSLGFSGLTIGGLVSLPILLHFVVRPLGGVAADRWGSRRLLIVSYSATALAGPLLYFAHSFTPLLVAQLAVNLSRATYLVGILAQASRLPGATPLHLGRLTATYHAAQISGSVTAGLLATELGFSASFLVVTVAGILAVASAFGLPPDRIAALAGGRPAAAVPFRSLLRMRPLRLAMACAYCAGLPMGLCSSFFPVYLAQAGTPPATIGWVLSMRAVGGALGGLLLARRLTPAHRPVLIAFALAVMAGAVALSSVSADYRVVGLAVFALGPASAVLEISYQLMAGQAGVAGGLARALALSGLGWSMALFSVPALTGTVGDTLGLPAAFRGWALVLLTLALAALPAYRWATAFESDRPDGAAGIPERPSNGS